jgi:hypothetical protein
MLQSNAQLDSTCTAITLTRTKFDYYVDSCIILLETKKLSEISDSGHIYIMLCDNTIFYTRILGLQRFAGGRYDKFENAISNALYARNITSLYPDWKSTGSGIYFPRLQIAYGGLMLRHSVFKVLAQ